MDWLALCFNIPDYGTTLGQEYAATMNLEKAPAKLFQPRSIIWNASVMIC